MFNCDFGVNSNEFFLMVQKGQECVQDVVQKALEIFKLLQSKSLPVS
jgi:hypothetical protein